MRGEEKEPTREEKEMQARLDDLLGGERKEFMVVQREAFVDKPNTGTYRAYGNINSPDEIIRLLLNFLDGMLDDEEFTLVAHMVSKRAMKRMGLKPPDLTGVLEQVEIAMGGGKPN